MEYSEKDLVELFELMKVDILGRKRIQREMEALRMAEPEPHRDVSRRVS